MSTEIGGKEKAEATEEFRSWPSSKFADPKDVEHGIRLSKPIAETVKSWWAKRWLSIIHQFGLGVRLERAKFYATRGQVLSIQIENGVVKSLVQGADNDPYRVIIAVKTIPKAIWKAILSDFALNSSFGIRVTTGSLPPEEELDQTFCDNGVLLFPDRQGEMQTKCSCLDWSNPCKHIAAVYLLLAAEFEKDPLLIFKLRGLSANDLFALLRTPNEQNSDGEKSSVEASAGSIEIIAEQPSKPVAKRGRGRPPKNASRQESLQPVRQAKELVTDVKTFWKKSVKPADILDAEAPLQTEIASLPQSLGEFPFWQGNTDLLTAVRFIYELAPQHAIEVLAHSRSSDLPVY